MPQPQRKKNPTQYMAGSPLVRNKPKARQTPPKESGITEAMPNLTVREMVTQRNLSFRVEQALNPPIPKFKCNHMVLISEGELRFQNNWKRKFHTPKEPPVSFECVRCFPICKHGLELDSEEIEVAVKTGKRTAHNCPGCKGEFTNCGSLSAYLHKQNLSKDYGLCMAEDTYTARFGYTFRKDGKNYVQVGGSKNIDDVAENGIHGDKLGHGPSGMEDTDGVKTDDLGDPILYGPSESIKGFEQARTESTREALDVVSYEIVPSEDKLTWIVLGDKKEVSRHNTRKEAKQAIKNLTEFDYLNFKQSRDTAKLEHTTADVLTTPEVPSVPETFRGLKEQKPNRKIWKEREETELQKEITDEIEQYDLPVRAEYLPPEDKDA